MPISISTLTVRKLIINVHIQILTQEHGFLLFFFLFLNSSWGHISKEKLKLDLATLTIVSMNVKEFGQDYVQVTLFKRTRPSLQSVGITLNQLLQILKFLVVKV